MGSSTPVHTTSLLIPSFTVVFYKILTGQHQSGIQSIALLYNMASRPGEPTVRFFSPMPKGYAFVPKGDVYITSHCRKQTLAAHDTVYTVVNSKNNAIGIRVPMHIYESVQESHEATSDRRAQAVMRKDNKLEAEFRDTTLGQFPEIPPESLSMIVDRATRKGSGRVGRTGKLSIAQKAELAVRAYVRHVHTEYDQLMRGGTSRAKARSETYGKINEVIRAWGGKARHGGKSPKQRGLPPKHARRGEPRGKPTRSAIQRPEKAASGSPGRLRREKKQIVRRTRTTAASRGGINQEVEGEVTLRTRPKLGSSLRDDGDNESDEYEWSSWEEGSDRDSDYVPDD